MLGPHSAEICTLCGAPLTTRYEHVVDPQTREAFAVLVCERCALGETSPVPDDLDRYYGAAYYGGRYGLAAHVALARRCRMLRQSHTQPGRLLDVGCGDGAFLEAAQRAGWTVCGTELAAAAERARMRGLEVRGGIADFSGTFDAITLWHTLEHFRDPAAVLAEARAALAPTGVLMVAVPDAGGLQARLFGPHWFHLDVPRHLHHFNRRALAALLGRAGLRVDRWRHLEIEQELFGWLQSAQNRAFATPNVLFHALTGKPTRVSPATVAGCFALGAFLGPFALGASTIGAFSRRGATLTAIARLT